MLTSSGKVALGSFFLAEHLQAADNAGANVADRTSAIRITGLKAIPGGPKTFLKIETNHKITALDPAVACTLANSLFELLDGENPTRIEHLWQKLYRAHRNLRGGAHMVHVISAIDMALWDITGRLWGVPVYPLLGGPCRDRIRVYHTPKARKVPPTDVFPHSANPADIERIVSAIKAARAAVGQDGTVMFDAHCAIPPATLIQLAGAIQPYDVLFIEEVAVPGNIEVFKRLKAAINIPLATGERDRTIWEMIPYLQERCIDILQPDCAHHTKGITQMRKIAALAEAYFVPLAPHNTCSFLGLSASLHVAASIPLFLIHEAHPDNPGFNRPGIARTAWAIDRDGYVGLPQGPGLGVEVDEAAMSRVNATAPCSNSARTADSAARCPCQSLFIRWTRTD